MVRTSKQASTKGLEIEALHHKGPPNRGGRGGGHRAQGSCCLGHPPTQTLGFFSKKRTSKEASKGLEIEALHHKFFTQWGGWGRRQEGTQMLKMNGPPLTKTLGFSGKHAKILP